MAKTRYTVRAKEAGEGATTLTYSRYRDAYHAAVKMSTATGEAIEIIRFPVQYQARLYVLHG